MKVVLDTGPLLASVDRSDRANPVAERVIAELGRDLLVSDAVVAEADHLIRSRISNAAARAVLEGVSAGPLRRVPFDQRLFERAVEYDRTYADLGLGIVDASVMALAERERAMVLTFDFADFRATRPLRGGWWRLVVDEAAFRRILGP